MHVIVWEFVVRPDKIRDFIAAYKADGDWAQLLNGKLNATEADFWQIECD
jgi:hypothetical protein